MVTLRQNRTLLAGLLVAVLGGIVFLALFHSDDHRARRAGTARPVGIGGAGVLVKPLDEAARDAVTQPKHEAIDGRVELAGITRVVVADAWGEPIHSATVRAYSGPSDQERLVALKSTDSSGVAELSMAEKSLDRGDATLALEVSARGFDRARRSLLVSEFGEEITIRLGGWIRYEIPLIVPHDLQDDDDLEVTGPDLERHFRVMRKDVSDEMVHLRVFDAELPVTIQLQLLGGPPATVLLSKPSSRRERIVRLEAVRLELPGRLLTGRVTLAGKRRLDGLSFALREAGTRRYTVVHTDGRGEFEFPDALGVDLQLSQVDPSLHRLEVPARWKHGKPVFEFPGALLRVEPSGLPEGSEVRLMIQVGGDTGGAGSETYSASTKTDLSPESETVAVLCPSGRAIDLRARELFDTGTDRVFSATAEVPPLRAGEVRTVGLEFGPEEPVELVVPHFDGRTRTEFSIQDRVTKRRLESEGDLRHHRTGEAFRLPSGRYRLSWYPIERGELVPAAPYMTLDVRPGMPSAIIPQLVEPGSLEIAATCDEFAADERGEALIVTLFDVRSDKVVDSKWTHVGAGESEPRWKGRPRCQSTNRSSLLPSGPLTVRLSRRTPHVEDYHWVFRKVTIHAERATVLDVRCADLRSDD